MDYTTLTDTELQEIFHAATEETSRRNLISAALTREPILQTGYLTALGRANGEPYVAPTGYHDAYPKGWKVTWEGAEYEALRDGAEGVPGDSPDWKRLATDGEILPWQQPHAGNEYPVGAVVSHNGKTWRNDHTAPNGWEPGTPGSQWTQLD